MALPAGRVGVAPDQVDRNGKIKSSPTVKGMVEHVYPVGRSYVYDYDSLVTFVITGSDVGKVNVQYTPTLEIGSLSLQFSGTDNGAGAYDFIFTLWVPKNVEVQVLLRTTFMETIATIF